MPVKLLFIDRDGTLTVDKGYTHKVEDLKFIDTVIGALKQLQKEFLLVIITNQSGIGRGKYTEKDFDIFTEHMNSQLQKEGISITTVLHCPHTPEEACPCRKPNTILVENFLEKEKIVMDKEKSYVIGDKTTDIMLGENLGLKTVLVMTGVAGRDNKYKVTPTFTVKDMKEVASLLMRKT